MFYKKFKTFIQRREKNFPFVSNKVNRNLVRLRHFNTTQGCPLICQNQIRQDVKISQLLMNSSHQNTAASRCGLFDTLPTQTSFVQLWNSISRSGKLRIQFSFHHIWFQSTVDDTQNIQDQDRICIKFNKIKMDLVYFQQKFYLPALASQKYCHL